MEQNAILSDQRDARLGRMLVTMSVTMLPVLTYGSVSAFLTVALPKLLTSNPTGIILDLYQGPAGAGAHVGEAGQEKESDGLRSLPDHHLSRHPLLLLLHHPPGHSHLLWGSQLHGAQPFLRVPLGNISDKVRLKHFDHHPFGSVIIFEFLL